MLTLCSAAHRPQANLHKLYSAHKIPYLVLSFGTAVLLVSAFTTNKSSLAPCSEFKVAMLPYKILATHQPTCLHDTLLPYRLPRALRSSDQQLLQIPYTNTDFGQRSVSYLFTKIWNEISAIIIASATVATFKRRFKSHFS